MTFLINFPDHQARVRVLAAWLARALLFVSPSFRKEGAGKAGRRLAPVIRAQGNTHGVTTGEAATFRPSLRDWF